MASTNVLPAGDCHRLCKLHPAGFHDLFTKIWYGDIAIGFLPFVKKIEYQPVLYMELFRLMCNAKQDDCAGMDVLQYLRIEPSCINIIIMRTNSSFLK